MTTRQTILAAMPGTTAQLIEQTGFGRTAVNKHIRALRAAGERPKYLFTGPELTAVNLGMDVHDAQLDDPKTTIALMQQALEIVVKVIRLKKAERIKFEVPA